MISADLSGKCVLVTGGLSGIGLATVKTFAACGAQVAVNHLPDDPATDQVLDELNKDGCLIVSAPGDVSDPDQTETMVEQAIVALGRLDVLINNAGTSNTRTPIAFDDLAAMSESFWTKIMQTNLIGAARRAQIAGFDGVELHYAHAYTMASFLSATNNRRDGYGDSLENRVRLPIEVYQAVRETVGKDFVVGCRFLTEDCIENGSSTDDSSFFAQQFAAAGMDFVSTSRGGKFDDAKQPTIGDAAYPYTGPSGYECIPGYLSDAFGPFGRNFAATAKIRTAIRNKGFNTPVVVTGGIHDFQQAQSLLESGTADVIGLARQSLADPDWFFKLRSGRGDEIRVCEYTNYCEGLDRKHKQVTCQLWDRTDLDEPGISRSRDNRRRLVAPHWRSD